MEWEAHFFSVATAERTHKVEVLRDSYHPKFILWLSNGFIGEALQAHVKYGVPYLPSYIKAGNDNVYLDSTPGSKESVVTPALAFVEHITSTYVIHNLPKIFSRMELWKKGTLSRKVIYDEAILYEKQKAVDSRTAIQSFTADVHIKHHLSLSSNSSRIDLYDLYRSSNRPQSNRHDRSKPNSSPNRIRDPEAYNAAKAKNKCFYCGKQGHFFPECTQLAADHTAGTLKPG